MKKEFTRQRSHKGWETLLYGTVESFCQSYWYTMYFLYCWLYVPTKYCVCTTVWFKKMDSILYVYISWTIYDMWMIYTTFEREVLRFQVSSLEFSPSAEPYSSISWDQNGYYAAQVFLRVSEENVRRIQESFERNPRKSIRRASTELGTPQPTLWHVLRCRLLFNWVHIF